MATPKTGRPRGRPNGKNARNAQRDAFVHAVVAGLMRDLRLSKRRAIAVARYLLSDCATGLPDGWATRSRAWVASDSSGGAWVNDPVTYVVPARSTDGGYMPGPEQLEELTVRESTAVLAWWHSQLSWWMSHPISSRRPRLPITLSEGRIGDLYRDVQAQSETNRSFTCTSCGYVNESVPGRGEQISGDDACRACGVTIDAPFAQ